MFIVVTVTNIKDVEEIRDNKEGTSYNPPIEVRIKPLDIKKYYGHKGENPVLDMEKGSRWRVKEGLEVLDAMIGTVNGQAAKVLFAKKEQ